MVFSDQDSNLTSVDKTVQFGEIINVNVVKEIDLELH
jgi:hypothetical protein